MLFRCPVCGATTTAYETAQRHARDVKHHRVETVLELAQPAKRR